MPRIVHHLCGDLPRWCLITLLTVCAGCKTIHVTGLDNVLPGRKESGTEADEATKKAATGTLPQGHSATDLRFLLSMDYEEAKTISAQSTETATGARIAADSIEILKKDKDDRPIKLRAKGKVCLETGTAGEAKILCQELYFNNGEAVIRGKPIMQRGGSIVEGLEDKTVFYFLGQHLRVLGLHRLTNENAMVAHMPTNGPWASGPNPLLPALTEGVVPISIRTEMQKAAEAEAVLQKNRQDANHGTALKSTEEPKPKAAPAKKATPTEKPKAPKTEKAKS